VSAGRWWWALWGSQCSWLLKQPASNVCNCALSWWPHSLVYQGGCEYRTVRCVVIYSVSGLPRANCMVIDNWYDICINLFPQLHCTVLFFIWQQNEISIIIIIAWRLFSVSGNCWLLKYIWLVVWSGVINSDSRCCMQWAKLWIMQMLTTCTALPVGYVWNKQCW